MKLQQTKDYLLLIDEEAEIKENTWYENNGILFLSDNEYDEGNNPNNSNPKVTDFNNSIIAYYPLNSEVKELDLPLLPNPFEVDVEELSEKANGYAYYGKPLGEKYLAFKEGFIKGYKTAQPKQYSLEDILKFRKVLEEGALTNMSCASAIVEFDKFIQSLSTQQLPSEFIPEYENKCWCLKPMSGGCFECTKVLKTITNSEGKEELVGTYRY